MPTGIELLLEDHRRVEALFAAFAERPDGVVVGQVIDALGAHDDAEHGALYPLVGKVVGDQAMVERAARAHSAVKKQIDLMTSMEGRNLAAAFETLRELVVAHVQDEENNIFPALEGAATPQQLEALGARILQVKQRAG
jgi:hemerythrin superfamily protein